MVWWVLFDYSSFDDFPNLKHFRNGRRYHEFQATSMSGWGHCVRGILFQQTTIRGESFGPELFQGGRLYPFRVERQFWLRESMETLISFQGDSSPASESCQSQFSTTNIAEQSKCRLPALPVFKTICQIKRKSYSLGQMYEKET